MEDQGTPHAEASISSDTPAVETLPAPFLPPTPRANRRFVVTYAALGLVLVASVVGFLVYALRDTIAPAASWSSWSPPGGTTAVVSKAIADHVAPRYHLAGGGQLVAVVASAPNVTAGTQNVAINAVAVHSSQSGNTDVTQLDPGKTEMFSLCGLGDHCSIAAGQPSQERGQLVRREALETALYTFKYVPAIDSILVFMPPRKDDLTTTMVLFFQRANLKLALDRPLDQTLPRREPPRSDVVNALEGPTIDSLTLGVLFTSNLTELQSGGALLVLTPAL